MEDQTSLSANFVKPSPKSELSGEVGLYANEIAASIGVPAKLVREKLRSQINFDRMTKLGFSVATFSDINDYTGLEFSNYALSLPAAMFCVTKWNSDMADEYFAYLLRYEQGGGQFQQLANQDPLLSNILATSELRRVQMEHSKQIDDINAMLVDFSIGTIPTLRAMLAQAVLDAANASGGDKLIPFIYDLLIHKFGFGENCVSLADQIRLGQYIEVKKFLKSYSVPKKIVQKYYPCEKL